MGKHKTGRLTARAKFTALLTDVKGRIQSAQTRAILAVNAELVRLYWDIGRIIDDCQKSEGWGTAIIPRLATELQNELPDLKGFSERNIKRMLAFYREYPQPAVKVPPVVALLPGKSKVPQPAAQLDTVSKVPQPAALLPESLIWTIPWYHHVLLIEKVKDISTRR